MAIVGASLQSLLRLLAREARSEYASPIEWDNVAIRRRRIEPRNA